jgi:hypothetical protein
MGRRARDAHPWLEQYTNFRTGGGSRGVGASRLQQFEEDVRAGGKQCSDAGRKRCTHAKCLKRGTRPERLN